MTTKTSNSLCRLSGNPDIEQVLDAWLQPTNDIPATYISYLSVIQEYLTVQLVDLSRDEVDKIDYLRSMLASILCIKDDLKSFVIKGGGD